MFSNEITNLSQISRWSTAWKIKLSAKVLVTLLWLNLLLSSSHIKFYSDLTNYLTNGPLWFIVGGGCKHHYFQNNFYETVDCGTPTKLCKPMQTIDNHIILLKIYANFVKPKISDAYLCKLLQTIAKYCKPSHTIANLQKPSKAFVYFYKPLHTFANHHNSLQWFVLVSH